MERGKRGGLRAHKSGEEGLNIECNGLVCRSAWIVMNRLQSVGFTVIVVK